MKTVFGTLCVFTALMTTLLAQAAFASPPKAIPGSKECIQLGGVEICRELQDTPTRDIAFEMTYANPVLVNSKILSAVFAVDLSSSTDSTITRFDMEHSGEIQSLYLTTGCLEMGSQCKYWAPEIMKNFFKGMQNADGSLNPVGITLFFEDTEGNVDNRSGDKYVFQFGTSLNNF